MEVVIITGMSGAGKTQTVKYMEDMGYFCVDNLPIFLLPKFGELCSESEGQHGRYALVLDVRGGDFVNEVLDFTDRMEKASISVRILFLDCADKATASLKRNQKRELLRRAHRRYRRAEGQERHRAHSALHGSRSVRDRQKIQ